MNNRAQAINIFVYYFKLIAEKSEIRWDSDNAAEITAAVEAIFDEIDKVENKSASDLQDHFNTQVHTHV